MSPRNRNTQQSEVQAVQPQAPGEPVGRQEFEYIKYIVAAVVVVVAIGFITLIINYFYASQTSYQNLINQVSQQNTQIQLLNSKIDILTTEINSQPVK